MPFLHKVGMTDRVHLCLDVVREGHPATNRSFYVSFGVTFVTAVHNFL